MLKGAGLVGSTSEAFRMIKQGAVRLDGERVEDKALGLKSGHTCVAQVGKRRFARVTIE
jgi:tyrosyl-tRNA synthetase